MNAATATCRRCKAEMHREPLSGVTGDEGGITVTFQGLPALVCTQGHRRFVRPEFPVQLLKQLSGTVQMPAGEARGVLFKSYHCGSCGEKLAGAAAGSRTFEFDVGLEGVDPFRIALMVPVYACPSCGREQVRSLPEVTDRAPAAMARAFQSAEIPPG